MRERSAKAGDPGMQPDVQYIRYNIHNHPIYPSSKFICLNQSIAIRYILAMEKRRGKI